MRFFRSRQLNLRIVRGWHLNLRFSGGGTSEFAVFPVKFAVFSGRQLNFRLFQKVRTEFADCQRVPFEFAVFRRRHLRIRGVSVEFAVFSGMQLNLRFFRSRQLNLRIVRWWHLNFRFSGGGTSEFAVFPFEFAVFQWAAIEFAVSQYRILTKNK